MIKIITQPKFHLSIVCLFVLSGVVISTNTCIAQKLPNKQLNSLRAPADIKIDGKLAADVTFQAYNKAIETYYTISNDDVNLYLVVRSGHRGIATRIINGGLTLTIKPMAKKAAEHVAITYPVFDSKNRMTFIGRVIENGRGIEAVGKQADSLAKVNNGRMATKAKSIGVAGIPSVDTLISVYNDDGIKAAGAFDGKLYYNYELAVPLKYIQGLLTGDKKFAYQVKINATEDKGIVQKKDDAGRTVYLSLKIGASVSSQYATDFWGEYTLAQKP